MIKVTLRTAYGVIATVGFAEDLQEALAMTEAIEARFAAWEASGFLPLFADDPLGFYVGCSLHAEDLNGTTWTLSPDDGWENDCQPVEHDSRIDPEPAPVPSEPEPTLDRIPDDDIPF